MTQLIASTNLRQISRLWTLTILLAILSNAPTWAQFGDDCIVEDNGTGTITIPPAGCSFLHPQEVFMITTDCRLERPLS